MEDVDWASLARRRCLENLHWAMLAVQFGYAGFHVVSRAALDMGISMIVFLVYTNIIALLLLILFEYFLEKEERPALSPSLLFRVLVLALVRITATQGLYLLGLENTSPTFASIIQNSVPAIIYLMNDIFGRVEERIESNERARRAKMVGALSCVAGVLLVITVYKDPTIFGSLGNAKGKNWSLGFIYLIGHCLSSSAWKALKASGLDSVQTNNNSGRLSFTSYTYFFGVLQFLVIAAFIERNSQAWLVHSSTELFSVFYTGIVASGIAFVVKIWCIQTGGPLFVALHQPVEILFVAIMASNSLGETIGIRLEARGTPMIEGILPPKNESLREVFLDREEVFAKMSELRFLYINGAKSEILLRLPCNLRWFSWIGCSLEILPTNFYHKKLVHLDLSKSGIRGAWTNKPQSQNQFITKASRFVRP
ncbi:hypothetical protein NE237_031291 [Protea cynaroides]|uniref:EamA domain-containing protein n=1 Tax=Protea cynaroides TaxID=273540 RepID=A0A9Q0L1Z4_9MAGN|nr:hypothetical protein NE237_031291 [Protea cynaroides]